MFETFQAIDDAEPGLLNELLGGAAIRDKDHRHTHERVVVLFHQPHERYFIPSEELRDEGRFVFDREHDIYGRE